MKKLFSIVMSIVLFASFAIAQNRTVSLNVVGNRTKQIIVDGTTYPVNNSTATDEASVSLNNLATGSHSLVIVRGNTYNNRTTSTTTSFTLREGYDMEITINSNGTVNLSEVRSSGNRSTGMSTHQFNRLYNNTKAKASSSARSTFLEREFTNTSRTYTSDQVRQLIKLVNSESMRFNLAKLAYLKVSDKTNYNQVVTLLNSSSNRAALTNYMANVSSDSDVSTSAGYTPFTTSKFNTIYNEVLAENTANDRLYYLSNLFSKDFNYYTSAQARQLIQTLTSEVDRLTLAKEAYRGITDRSNYYNEISNILYSSTNRAELRTYINNHDLNSNNNNNTTVPSTSGMSTSSFNTLYNNIYYTSGSTARYNAINNAFITTGNYFTAAQARQLITLVNDDNTRLALAKASYNALVDKANYAVFNDLFSYQATRNEWYNFVQGGGATTYPGTTTGMSDYEFNNLYNSVNSSWSASTKFSTLSTAFQSTSNRFSASQVRQLLLLISSESDRLALAKSAYDNMVDPYSYTTLYDVFSTTATRNELARYVADVQNGGTGYSNRVAMSDADFRSIYRSVQLTFGLGAKYSSLTDIFNKETNYFTVSQAKQLIELVSSESNRLALAKLAWDNLTDPANINSIYDVFSSQSSKDELASYVSSNPYR